MRHEVGTEHHADGIESYVVSLDPWAEGGERAFEVGDVDDPTACQCVE